MSRSLGLLYGLICYVVFLGSFLYAVGFVGNLLVPKSIDSGTPGPLGISLLINAVLLGLFAIQHSVMARQGFKKIWMRVIPAAIERSTYVLLSSLILILLFWKWQPMPVTIWDVQNQVGLTLLLALQWLGWLMVLLSTFAINHFDLFGLRQVALLAARKEYTPLRFTNAGIYRIVRHPIMLGFVIAFWATPTMTAGHLLFAVASTGYIVVGILLEERDLSRAHGSTYMNYRRQVPMLIPGTKTLSEKTK